MVASPAFSEPKHRLNCFQNKSEGQSKSYCFGSGLLDNRYSSVFKDLARVRHVFHCIFRNLRRFYFLDIQKLKYAAAYFAYTQARPCSVTKFLAAKIGPEFGNKLYGQHL